MTESGRNGSISPMRAEQWGGQRGRGGRSGTGGGGGGGRGVRGIEMDQILQFVLNNGVSKKEN